MYFSDLYVLKWFVCILQWYACITVNAEEFMAIMTGDT